MDDLTSYAENTWCPGCGNFGLFNAFKKAVHTLEDRGIGRDHLVMTAGIGCHAKIFDYLKISGIYSLHGRSMSTAQGMKIANPDLKVVAFAGDGDALGEGLAHVIFAAKRNTDFTLIVHNNGVYGLTTGQFTPTSEKGYKGPSTPRGSIEDPFNSLALLLEAGASFVARGYSGRVAQLSDIMVQAIEHKGFSYVEVLQPCATFNNNYKVLNEIVSPIDAPARDLDGALALTRQEDTRPIGVFYRIEKPSFEKELLDDHNPVIDPMPIEKRQANIRALLER